MITVIVGVILGLLIYNHGIPVLGWILGSIGLVLEIVFYHVPKAFLSSILKPRRKHLAR